MIFLSYSSGNLKVNWYRNLVNLLTKGRAFSSHHWMLWTAKQWQTNRTNNFSFSLHYFNAELAAAMIYLTSFSTIQRSYTLRIQYSLKINIGIWFTFSNCWPLPHMTLRITGHLWDIFVTLSLLNFTFSFSFFLLEHSTGLRSSLSCED